MGVRRGGQEGALDPPWPAKIVCFCPPWKILPSSGKKSADAHESTFLDTHGTMVMATLTASP